MKSTLTQKQDNLVTLNMVIPANEATSAYNTAVNRIAQHINIDGFRKGKAPRAVIERHVGVDRIQQEALDILTQLNVINLENPIKAIDWLNEGNVPDLIISDIRMPLMRGYEFLRYMKANELFKSIPIVMLSSEESTTERIKLLEEGAEDYILKPFNPLELKIRIKKIID